MKKFSLISFLLLTVLFAVTAFSQGLRNEIKVVRPDFSGTWKYTPVWPDGPEPRHLSVHTWLLTVEQKLPSIFVTVLVKGDDKDIPLGTITLYTDGRGDEFSRFFESNDSTTQWQGNKLVITFFSSGKDRKEAAGITELELSSDGSTLTVRPKTVSIRQNPKGERITSIDDRNGEVAVFHRVPDITAKSVRKFDLEEE